MSKIERARDKCSGWAISYPFHTFDKMYPFTTENISGYIDNFDLEGKSLLTVGSSCDQAINASLKGCKDITILDICPYTEDYFHLKTSALEELDYEDFFKFLCYRGYYSIYFDNFNALNKKSFEKLKESLKSKSKESYDFWNTILSEYKGRRIRQRCFMLDEDSMYAIKGYNPYLHSEESYLKARESLKNTQVQIITGDITKIDIPSTYDNIWLSNLPAYLSQTQIKKLFKKLKPHLNDNGKMLISYLYGITENTEYQPDWAEVYNLEKIRKVLEYEPDLISFTGVQGVKIENKCYQDSALVYQKKK